MLQRLDEFRLNARPSKATAITKLAIERVNPLNRQ
jgi:hypothetical protein